MNITHFKIIKDTSKIFHCICSTEINDYEICVSNEHPLFSGFYAQVYITKHNLYFRPKIDYKELFNRNIDHLFNEILDIII